MKHLQFILMLLIIMILTSCQVNPLEKTYKVESSKNRLDYSESNKGKESEDVISINNEKPIEQAEKVIDIHYVAEKYFTDDLYGSAPLTQIAADIGIECFRKTNADALYSIHKTKEGGMLYIFYTNLSEYINDNHIIRWFFIQKKLSYEDFEKIKEGDTIDDVKQIDSTTQIFENIYNANQNYWNDMGGFETWHYLNDGILRIGYRFKNGKLEVIMQSLSQNFEIHHDTEIRRTYDGHILPIDKIK